MSQITKLDLQLRLQHCNNVINLYFDTLFDTGDPDTLSIS